MRYWVGVSAAFGVGSLLGIAVGQILVEEKLRAEYKESAASYRRAMEAVRIDQMVGEIPHEEEGHLLEGGPVTEVDRGDNVVHLTGDGSTRLFKLDEQTYTPADENPYHKAVAAVETPIEMFVEGGVNDYGISYIEEEEYHDDDGRYKGQIVMVVSDDLSYSFFLDGQQIFDWDERLGDSIIVDFNRLVPDGVTPVLYVRNHKTDEDYEVSRELP